MYKRHRKMSFFSLWLKTIRKTQKVKSKLEIEQDTKTRFRLNRKLKSLIQKVKRLSKRFYFPIPALSALLALSTGIHSQQIDQIYFEDLLPKRGFTASYDIQLNAGRSTAIGDFNGDGKDDFAIQYNTNYTTNCKILFGTGSPSSSNINLENLDGSDGFAAVSKYESEDMAMMDLNGDGFDDIVLGQPYAYDQRGGHDGGQNYVLFGNNGPQEASVNLDEVSTDEKMIIYTDEFDYQSGYFVHNGGDINGDGFDDLYSVCYSEGYYGSVIFGGDSLPDSLDLQNDLNSTKGFTINSPEIQFHSGDVNGDNKSDIILFSSYTYYLVIFGQDAGVIDIVTAGNNGYFDGNRGFLIETWSVTADNELLDGVLDFNNDAFDDLLIHNRDKDSLFLIYGHTGPFTPYYDLDNNGVTILDGANGMYIAGIPDGDTIVSVTHLDFNNDALEDVLFSLSPSNGVVVIYGNKAGLQTTDISSMQAGQGFKIIGFGNKTLTVENGGDFNADGISDLIIYEKALINSTERFVLHMVKGQNLTDTLYNVTDLQSDGGFDLILSDQANILTPFKRIDFNGDGYNDVAFSTDELNWSTFKFILSEEDPTAIAVSKTIAPQKRVQSPYVVASNLLLPGFINNQTVKIFDMSGRLITRSKVRNNIVSIKKLSSGIYMVALGNRTFKIVKK